MATLSVPEIVPSSSEDADALHKAFEGLVMDENAIISILAHRNAEQRMLICHAYRDIYGEDFLKSLESDPCIDFLRLVYLWILHPTERDAILAKEAVQKWHPSSLVLVEILCSRSPNQLIIMKKIYKEHFKITLEEDVLAHTNGSFRMLLIDLVGSYRNNGLGVNMRLASLDVKLLHEKISEEKYDDPEVIWILSHRSKMQLIATFNQYKKKFGHEITEDFEVDSKNEFLGVLTAIVNCLTRPEKYFAGVLHRAMVGLGTDELALSRVVATRAEVDMKQIKKEYLISYGVNLHVDLVGDNSQAYKDMLLTLVGS